MLVVDQPSWLFQQDTSFLDHDFYYALLALCHVQMHLEQTINGLWYEMKSSVKILVVFKTILWYTKQNWCLPIHHKKSQYCLWNSPILLVVHSMEGFQIAKLVHDLHVLSQIAFLFSIPCSIFSNNVANLNVESFTILIPLPLLLATSNMEWHVPSWFTFWTQETFQNFLHPRITILDAIVVHCCYSLGFIGNHFLY